MTYTQSILLSHLLNKYEVVYNCFSISHVQIKTTITKLLNIFNTYQYNEFHLPVKIPQ